MNHRVPIISANNLNREVVVRYFFFFFVNWKFERKTSFVFVFESAFCRRLSGKGKRGEACRERSENDKKYYESKSRATVCGSRWLNSRKNLHLSSPHAQHFSPSILNSQMLKSFASLPSVGERQCLYNNVHVLVVYCIARVSRRSWMAAMRYAF